MNELLEWLGGGDLRSDGAANEAANAVLTNIDLFQDLFEGLSHSNETVRGRAADALEKVARKRPDLFRSHFKEVLSILDNNELPMLRWHLAMILGHLSMFEETISESVPALVKLLKSDSVFEKSWAISSLAIIARVQPEYEPEAAKAISRLKNDPSVAIRARVRYAMEALLNPQSPFPKTWNKSAHIDV